MISLEDYQLRSHSFDESVCYECKHLYMKQASFELYQYFCDEGYPQCGMKYGCYAWERKEEWRSPLKYFTERFLD